MAHVSLRRGLGRRGNARCPAPSPWGGVPSTATALLASSLLCGGPGSRRRVPGPGGGQSGPPPSGGA